MVSFIGVARYVTVRKQYLAHPGAPIGSETKFQFPACRCITRRPLFHAYLTVHFSTVVWVVSATQKEVSQHCDLLACRFESS